jgi:pseudomonalisin
MEDVAARFQVDAPRPLPRLPERRSWLLAGRLTWLVVAASLPMPASAAVPLQVMASHHAASHEDRVRLPGHLHPLARAENDLGPTDPKLRMERIVLMLRQPPGVEARLHAFLAAQQDASSPDYHHWLSPEQFAERFGPPAAQAQAVAAWIKSEGFSVERVARSRGWIEISGTAGQVERTFGVPIHDFKVDGQIHHANAGEPSVPAAMATRIAGFLSLHDFIHPPLSLHRQVTPEAQLNGQNALAPADFATIYDVNPLYSQGLTGTGVTIAITGRTEILLSDVTAFRSYFGLPVKDPVIIHNGVSPGNLGAGEEIEGDLDVEWSGAVAPQATIDFVVSASTYATDGVALSAEYIVDHALAPIMSVSFGSCEIAETASSLSFWSDLWAQAAAEGITVVVASGDAGVGGCFFAAPSVSGLCSPPYDVCVGGTQFADTPASAWWAPQPDPVTKESALSYIPEVAWNEPWGATGGGASAVFPKPAWQAAAGVPGDGQRDVPDLSLVSSVRDGHLVFSEGSLIAVGGTSAAAPALAGLLALVVQRTGSSQGNANPALYALGNAQYAQGGPAVFHDVTSGNNSFSGLTGYSCGPGYDLATGLGSVDAAALVAAWPARPPPAADFSLSLATADFFLIPGQSASTVVRLRSFGGFQAPVTLAVTGLPPGVQASLSPPSLSGGGSSLLQITTTTASATGWASLQVVGSGGGITHTLPIDLLLALDTLLPAVRFLVPLPGTGFAQRLAAGADGAVWFTVFALDSDVEQIGRITGGGAITEFPVPFCTLGPCGLGSIAPGPDGAIWFTMFGPNSLGRVTPSGSVSEIALPADAWDFAEDLKAGPDGALWVLENGPHAKMERLAGDGTFTSFPLPPWTVNPYVINYVFGTLTAGPDGALWYADYASSAIGRLTTTGALTELSLSPQTGPGFIIPGPDGAIWFNELNARKIGRIGPSGEVTEIATGMPGKAFMGTFIVGADGNLWFNADVADASTPSLLARMTPDGQITWYQFVGPLHDMVTGLDGNLWFADNWGRIGTLPFPAFPRPTSFYTVPPCRLLDTRLAPGPLGGPAVTAGELRDLPVIGSCGIPRGAKALAANVTVVNPATPGSLTIGPRADMSTSNLSFSAGQVRAGSSVLELSALGHLILQLNMPAGEAHLLVDVTGYFQ